MKCNNDMYILTIRLNLNKIIEVNMKDKKRHQRITFIFDENEVDIDKCVEIIMKHTTRVTDIQHQGNTITAFLPIDAISYIKDDFCQYNIPYQIIYEVDLRELWQEQDRQHKKLTAQHTAIWYAFQFERQRVQKENLMPFVTSGAFCDIVTAEPDWDHTAREQEDVWLAQLEQSMRIISVVGHRYKQPTLFALPDKIIQEQNSKTGKFIEDSRYYVYYIYNLNIGAYPRLVMLNSMFLRKHYQKLRRREISIHNIAKGIRVNKIKIHKLPRLTESVERMVINFLHIE
jgi:hypothetical protein